MFSGISAELRDVFLHPLDSGTLIQESEIRIWFAVAAFYGLLMKQRVRHKPKCIQAIGHTDHNDAVRGEMRAVEFLFKCAAALIGSAVDPDHDRAAFRRLPCYPRHIRVMPESKYSGRGNPRSSARPDRCPIHDHRNHRKRPGRRLHRGRPEIEGLQHTIPWQGRLRRTPAQTADGRLGERDPSEHGDALIFSRQAFDSSLRIL